MPGQSIGGALGVEQDKKRDREFYPNLEAAREVAALMVALFHIGLTRYSDAFGHDHQLIIPTRGSDWGDVGARVLGNGLEPLSSFSYSAVSCSRRSWRADQQTSEITLGNSYRGACFVFTLA